MNGAIRLATPADATLLPDLERSAGDLFRTMPGLAFVADGDIAPVAFNLPLIAQGLVWLAEADGVPAGFLRAEIAGDALHVLELAVALPFQKRGLGRALLDASIAEARRRGCAAVTLTTFAHVAWNAPFYARHGFVALTAPDARLAALVAGEAARGLPNRVAMQRML